MLLPRLIPCLLIDDDALVKTQGFKSPKYVGDPLNAVRIFNEKEVDELIVLDISATRDKKQPNYDLIRDIASVCQMPLCYGGGVESVGQLEKIISLGVEKVSLSTAAFNSPKLVEEASSRVGSQSVVVVIDTKKPRFSRKYEVFINNCKMSTGVLVSEFAKKMEDLGAGEIVVNSINRDGNFGGYDLDLVEMIRKTVSLPITVLGGAGSLEDIKVLYERFGVIGAGAGSLFIFKGKYRAVLINYPSRKDKEAIFTYSNALIEHC